MTDPTIAAREREVERNREQLAETVDALHAKLDVKTQAQAKMRQVQDRVRTQLVGVKVRASTQIQSGKGRASTQLRAAQNRASTQIHGARGQASTQVQLVRGRATTAEGKPRPELFAGVVTAFTSFVALEWWSRR